MRNRIKTFIKAFLMSVPIDVLIIVSLSAEHKNSIIPTDVITGIISAYGIIIGFWSAILGLSKSEHIAVWRISKFSELTFFLSLGFLACSVVFLTFHALDIFPSVLVLDFAMVGFYITCISLGLMIHEAFKK